MFKPEDFRGKRALVMGLGRSGLECAKLLAGKGFDVLVSEQKAVPASRPGNSRIAIETGGHSEEAFKCGFAVKSPGIFPQSPVMKRLKDAGIPVFSETEVGLAFCPTVRVFAVTGTNGKTTTTTLVHDILKLSSRKDGFSAHVCGNIGIPLSSAAMTARDGDMIALEISSYQLEDSSFFSPESACILNITPDHLDHHGGMENYIAAKRKVFSSQKADASCVFNAEDEICVKLARECKSEKLFFSSVSNDKKLNAVYDGKDIIFRFEGEEFRIAPPKLPGLHNIENAMCAGLMTLGRGICLECVREAFAAFRGVEHRIEDVSVVKGIRCINDSKATNVDSTLVALKSLAGAEKNIWLILGGLDKGSPYAPLAPLIKKSVRGILTIGNAAAKIEKELAGVAPIFSCVTMEGAVDKALRDGDRGDILLLSPACASFDQFKDYEERGRVFKQIILRQNI